MQEAESALSTRRTSADSVSVSSSSSSNSRGGGGGGAGSWKAADESEANMGTAAEQFVAKGTREGSVDDVASSNGVDAPVRLQNQDPYNCIVKDRAQGIRALDSNYITSLYPDAMPSSLPVSQARVRHPEVLTKSVSADVCAC